MRVAEVIAETLSAAGVRTVFGQPGGEVVALVDALVEHGIRFVLTGNEPSAAFMAGAVGRLAGAPGVCLATLGPGAANLALGVGAALLDRDPLLAISARTATARARISNKQNLPLNDLFRPITKWSAALDGGGTAVTVTAALRMAAAPPRGPVYLSLPGDVAVAPERADEPGLTPPVSPTPDGGQIERIAQALNAARRPVAVVGPALDPARDTASVRGFLNRTGMPFTVVPQGKGIADETATGFLGTVAPAAGDAAIGALIEQSDCLLGVGFDPVESSRSWHFRLPFYSIASGPVGFRDFKPTLQATGDVSALLGRLESAYRGAPEWPAGHVHETRSAVASAIEPPHAATRQGLSPYHVVRAIRDLAPDDTIASMGVGSHKMVMAQAWRTTQPRAFLVSNGLSAMGYAVPSAVAAARLFPDRPVVCVVGDGDFSMTVHELETARRSGAAPLCVVLVDRALSIIKLAQQTRGLAQRGVDMAAVDWARVAEGFGARALQATTLADVRSAVEHWLTQRELTVLAVPIDPTLYVGLAY